MKNINKNQSEMKNTISEMKNIQEELYNRLNEDGIESVIWITR